MNKEFDPRTHVLRKRGDKWIPVDKQIIRWRKLRRLEAQAKAAVKELSPIEQARLLFKPQE